MTDKKTRWSTDEKIRIVLQTFNPETRLRSCVVSTT